MNIGRATEYSNTSQLFIGVNLLKLWRVARMEAPTGRTEVVSGKGYPPLQ